MQIMKKYLKLLLPIIFILLSGTLYYYYMSNTSSSDKPIIHLKKLSILPDNSKEIERNSIKIAVASILSPEATIESYKPFISYIGRKIGKQAILVQRKTYQETNTLIENGYVSLGFICTGAYLYGNRSKMQILAIPQINGKITYQAYIIAKKSSDIKSFSALRGKRFAFTDPISNTGYVYPLYLLRKMGKTPDSFFKKTIFTYSHNRSIQAVYDGIVDAASVDSIVFSDYMKQHPKIRKDIMIIGKSVRFPIPPVVVPEKLSSNLKKELQNVLININKNSSGRKILKNIGIDRFVIPKPGMYKKFIKKYQHQ